MENLKPCPFCGSDYISIFNPGYTHAKSPYNVECENCNSKGPYRDTKEEAILAWNKRGR